MMSLVLMAAALVSGGAAASQMFEPVPLIRAIAVAERAVKGQVTDAELEARRDGRLIYKVELFRGSALFEVSIDARSGRVLQTSQPRIAGYWQRLVDRDELPHLRRARALSGMIGDLEIQTGGKALEVSFDVAAGRPYYEVEIATNAGVTEVQLDPATGKRLPFLLDD